MFSWSTAKIFSVNVTVIARHWSFRKFQGFQTLTNFALSQSNELIVGANCVSSGWQTLVESDLQIERFGRSIEYFRYLLAHCWYITK